MMNFVLMIKPLHYIVTQALEVLSNSALGVPSTKVHQLNSPHSQTTHATQALEIPSTEVHVMNSLNSQMNQALQATTNKAELSPAAPVQTKSVYQATQSFATRFQ